MRPGEGAATHSVVKAIRLLELLSQREVATVQDLSVSSGMPKPTVVRLLGTLGKSGLVRRLSRRSGYCLKSGIADLAAGYFGIPALLDIGSPHAAALTRDLLWPSAIATPHSGAMVVRYSTIPVSPYAHVTSTMNKRLSLVERAHGRAYLAFCKPPERDELFARNDELRRLQGAERLRFLDVLRSVRAAGYALRPSSVDPDTSTIAAPVLISGEVRATIGMTFFKSVVQQQQQRLLARKVMAAAGNIGSEMEIVLTRPPSERFSKPGE